MLCIFIYESNEVMIKSNELLHLHYGECSFEVLARSDIFTFLRCSSCCSLPESAGRRSLFSVAPMPAFLLALGVTGSAIGPMSCLVYDCEGLPESSNDHVYE